MHSFLASDMIGETINHVKAMLVITDKFLYNIIDSILDPPDHLTFDASQLVATTMIKVMRARKIGPFKK